MCRPWIRGRSAMLLETLQSHISVVFVFPPPLGGVPGKAFGLVHRGEWQSLCCSRLHEVYRSWLALSALWLVIWRRSSRGLCDITLGCELHQHRHKPLTLLPKTASYREHEDLGADGNHAMTQQVSLFQSFLQTEKQSVSVRVSLCRWDGNTWLRQDSVRQKFAPLRFLCRFVTIRLENFNGGLLNEMRKQLPDLKGGSPKPAWFCLDWTQHLVLWAIIHEHIHNHTSPHTFRTGKEQLQKQHSHFI